jgi:hypothetical protein
VQVLSSSATVVQVPDSASFVSSAVSCWFYDAGSGRTYMKILISGYTSFSADYNAAGGGGGGGGAGGGGGGGLVQVSDCTVSVASGGSATALIPVSWNFVGTVSLTQISFQGDGAVWLVKPILPLTLQPNGAIHVGVNVPSGVADGNYSVQVSCQFTFQGGLQSVVSHVTVQVGAVGGFGSDLANWFNSGVALLAENVWLVTMSSTLIMMLVVVTVVVGRRRR